MSFSIDSAGTASRSGSRSRSGLESRWEGSFDGLASSNEAEEAAQGSSLREVRRSAEQPADALQALLGREHAPPDLIAWAESA